MTKAIELTKQHGIKYFFTPRGTLEMHGTDRQIEAFADAVRKAALLEAAEWFAEMESCAETGRDLAAAHALRRMAKGEK